ncbi:unnamed protein product, partial [marine sediment metagenome]
ILLYKHTMVHFIHAGYMLFLEQLSEEDRLKLKPLLAYQVVEKKKKVVVSEETKYIKLKKKPYVAMKYSPQYRPRYNYNYHKGRDNQFGVYVWFNTMVKKTETDIEAIIKYVYVKTDIKVVVAEGHVNGCPIYVVLSNTVDGYSPITIKKMASSGTLGVKHAVDIKVRCNIYGWDTKNQLHFREVEKEKEEVVEEKN